MPASGRQNQIGFPKDTEILAHDGEIVTLFRTFNGGAMVP